ncbi:IucA/IucC family protein [Halotia branconii]|uniref:IucA/IucC family siderophore biosynthesis protein n=1 Tax=Halotia branconii CENA392 TaxID=1539056 RepID=A0AAJ6P940_9CYAN|nr:IucA/IucC family siderophore biosynthesis protein [Halotia branconii]WGV25331.1 IucA/IucC family siderophore biosynthesis protein [Halotia branconii CENA392]
MMSDTITKLEVSLQTQELTDKEIAERATIQSFLNCYLRETNTGKLITKAVASTDIAFTEVLSRTGANSLFCCILKKQCLRLLIGIKYWSLTGRHVFSFPLFYQPSTGNLLELDYVTLVALLTKELALNSGSNSHQDELLSRVIQSYSHIEKFVRERKQDKESLYQFNNSFINTEQALVFGHHLHPTPKSRQGFSEQELVTYSPELKGNFPLHYFRAHQSITVEGSALSQTATALIKAELIQDLTIDEEFKQKYCQIDEYSLLPIHPWEANYLLNKPEIQKLINRGLLQDLGEQGKVYQPTTSIRTVYHPQSAFMLKLSLNVKITNSLRINLYKELARSVEVYQILAGKIGKKLRQKFPNFHVIRDPAYITIQIDGVPINGFSTILRENPFLDHPETDATCLIALCQDAIFDDGSRLKNVIQQLAQQESRSTEEVSLNWFRDYLQVYLEPILWLYFTYGVGLEAHQQNSVLQLENGYPKCLFYRDNQGYYYRRSCHQLLDNILPGISDKSETICDDAVVDERLGYYLFINNLFGLINAFGVAGLVDEKLLLKELRNKLEEYIDLAPKSTKLLENLLFEPKLRCKANLLTRFHDMDELVGSVATQSVYVNIDNPLLLIKK